MRDKILLYLADLATSGAGGLSLAGTQVGIANAVGLHRSHVSRVLTALAREGLVTMSRQRVPGFPRAMTVCALTPAGAAAAKSLQASYASLVADAGAARPDAVRSSGLAQPGQALRRQGPSLWRSLVDAGAAGAGPAPGPAAGFVWDLEDAPVVQGFAGRAAELAKLGEWLRTLEPSCIVEGPGGIGKSTLVAHAVARADLRRHALWIRLADSTSAESLLARLDGFLGRLGRPLPQVPGASPSAVLEQVPSRLRGLPVLLVLDDVHKADDALRTAFEGLAAAAHRRGDLKLVWIGRTLHLPPAARRRALHLELAPLVEADCRHLLAELDVPPERHAGLARRAGGSPLFLELLAASDDGAAREDFVRHLLGGRGMAGPERTLLTSLSALRVPVSPEALERLLPADALASLEGLVRARLVFRRADGAVELHDEVRDALSGQLLPGQRRALHEAWSRALEPREGLEDAVEYLHHLTLAGRRAQAAWWALRNQRRLLEWARARFTATPDQGPSPGPPRSAA